MRLSRAKQMRKHLRFYRIVYGIAPPYAVLLDGSFIHMALKVKMDILDRLKKLLLGEDFKCFVPRAVLDELRALGPTTATSLQWAEACCEVLDNPPSATATNDSDGGDAPTTAMSAGDAIRALVGARNEGRYMVATQDQELKADLRHVPSVALLFVARAVLLMEPPSDASRHQSAATEKGKVRRLDEEERALLAAVKGKGKGTALGGASEGPGQGQLQKVRRKKKARGPNPLSVKKGKKPATKGGSKGGGSGERGEGKHGGGDGEKKRKRKHKKHKEGGAAVAAAGGGD